MSVAILIPARYASSRYLGKPLANLRGAGGIAKPLIQRSWEAASAVPGIDRVAVATDDERIGDAVAGFGGEVLMTSTTCRNGTERCAEAVAQMAPAPEIVVNLQGDAPLTPPWFIEALVGAMQADPQMPVATPVLRCEPEALARFQADRRAGRVGATTAVFGLDGCALYFSKEVLPFLPQAPAVGMPVPVFHHVGVYAYRPVALAAYAAAAETPLERLEGLEQLRFLETGTRVHCVEVEARGADFWELNNPEDVATVEAALAARGIA
ncbi:MAG: manno-octulosonate cytidylyltransferase [Pseudomonadota bacterium]